MACPTHYLLRPKHILRAHTEARRPNIMLHRYITLVGHPLHLSVRDNPRPDQVAVAGVLPRHCEVIVVVRRLDEGPFDCMIGLAGRGWDVADAEVRDLRPRPAPGAVLSRGEGDVVLDAVGWSVGSVML
jgi:hypothetical protein